MNRKILRRKRSRSRGVGSSFFRSKSAGPSKKEEPVENGEVATSETTASSLKPTSIYVPRSTAKPIYLDVGGHVHASTRKTLEQAEFFYKNLDDLPGAGTRSDPKFLDRDGTMFNLIMQHLRQPDTVLLPDDDSMRTRLWEEAEYYGLDSLKTQLMDNGYAADMAIYICWKHNSTDCGIGATIPYGNLWKNAGADSSIINEINKCLGRGLGLDPEKRIEFTTDVYPYDHHKETILFFTTYLQCGRLGVSSPLVAETAERLRKLANSYKCKSMLKYLSRAGVVAMPVITK